MCRCCLRDLIRSLNHLLSKGAPHTSLGGVRKAQAFKCDRKKSFLFCVQLYLLPDPPRPSRSRGHRRDSELQERCPRATNVAGNNPTTPGFPTTCPCHHSPFVSVNTTTAPVFRPRSSARSASKSYSATASVDGSRAATSAKSSKPRSSAGSMSGETVAPNALLVASIHSCCSLSSSWRSRRPRRLPFPAVPPPASPSAGNARRNSGENFSRTCQEQQPPRVLVSCSRPFSADASGSPSCHSGSSASTGPAFEHQKPHP
jgi:hypothetical protein